MNEITEMKVLSDYNIWLKFNDEEEKVVNCRPFIGMGFTAALIEYSQFEKVSIDSGGGLVWENGFDICPNFLKKCKGEKIENLKLSE